MFLRDRHATESLEGLRKAVLADADPTHGQPMEGKLINILPASPPTQGMSAWPPRMFRIEPAKSTTR
jgi:hypothetical protein